jgi:hypothetical protein
MAYVPSPSFLPFTYLEAMSAFNFSAKSESGLAIMPGLGAGVLFPLTLLPRGLDVELRTVRDLGLVEPASALMFDGERGSSGEIAMILLLQEIERAQNFGRTKGRLPGERED